MDTFDKIKARTPIETNILVWSDAEIIESEKINEEVKRAYGNEKYSNLAHTHELLPTIINKNNIAIKTLKHVKENIERIVNETKSNNK